MASREREVVTGGRPWPEGYTYAPALRLGDTVLREFLKDAMPASTGVIVAGLLREGALIEISAVAVLRR